MKKPKHALFLLGVLLSSAYVGCSEQPNPPSTSTGTAFAIPSSTPMEDFGFVATRTGWTESTPEAQGMDSNQLAELLKLIENEGYGIDSLVIARNGAVVLEAKVFPFSIFPEARHELFSCTKSVLSILIGIAIDQGDIQSVDQPVVDFFDEQEIENLSAAKRTMTLEDLLTMSSGLDCRDSYLYGMEGLHQMQQSSDWAAYALNLPMIAEPGTRFEYCNGASMLLSEILQQATGEDAASFAEQRLFSILGIEDTFWETDPSGVNLGYSELQMRPHDLAKLGQLLLNKGRWGGAEIVSSSWIEASTQAHFMGTLQEGYGYHWWADAETGASMALGHGGQYLIVLPEQELVVVFLSDLPESQFYLPEELYQDYILPSIRSDGPLPEDPRGNLLLRLYRYALEDN